MNLHTLKLEPSNLKKLSLKELKHVLQLSEIELDNYRHHSKNYPPNRKGRAERYISGWEEFIDLIKTHIG